MFGKNLVITLGLAGGLVAVTGADTVSTRVFSNFQGGEPLTLITTIAGSATGLASLPAGESLSTIAGNHGPAGMVTQDSVTLPPGVFVTTILANHAPPEVFTRTSSTLPPGVYLTTIPVNRAPPQVYTLTSSVPLTTTLTTTDIVRSTITVNQPTSIVTVQVSEVSAKPSLVTGLCFWGQGGIEIPCTYTAGNLPNNVNPTAVNSSNNLTIVNGSTVLTTLPSSAAMSSRGNPFKFLLAGVKGLAVREALEPAPVDWSKVNMTVYTNTSEPEFDKYRGENGVHWAKCDHVPLIFGPLILTILYIAHCCFVRWKWNKPSRSQSHNGRHLIAFMVIWGISFPLFVYLEIYTSIATAWRDCIPDPNRTYPY